MKSAIDILTLEKARLEKKLETTKDAPAYVIKDLETLAKINEQLQNIKEKDGK